MARILIIDDDDLILETLRATMEGAGHEVITATEGKSGLDRLREDPVDLVITDIIMPGKEGMETIADIKLGFPRLPIIAMSGGSPKGMGSYLSTAEDLGACRSLKKPIHRKVLLETVREVLADPDATTWP